MRRLLKWLLILGVPACMLAAVAVPALTWMQRRAAPRYLTAEVARGRIESVVNSTGTIKPVQSVSVGATVSGPIAEVYVDYNSVVKEHDLLARIDAKLFQAAVDRDLAALDTQKAELARVQALRDQARSNEKRATQLVAINKDYLAETDMDNFHFTLLSTEAQVKLAKANIAQAEANLTNSKANLGYTEIRSPVSGIIIERKIDPGQTVAASFQTPELFIIAPDMDKHMFVYANVDEADIGLIRSAQQQDRVVKFTVDAYPDDLFEGTIYQIRKNSTTTQNVVTYPVVIEARNPNLKLLPGMTANLSFQVEARDNVLRVPAAALRYVPLPSQVRPEDRHYVDTLTTAPTEGGARHSASEKAEKSRGRQHRPVWVQEGPFLRAIPITLGLIENQYAEVTGGDLAEGQAVVTGTEGALPPR